MKFLGGDAIMSKHLVALLYPTKDPSVSTHIMILLWMNVKATF
jgi:hypothetical protein